ncbi:MAG TPA: hypothetical protein VK473_18180 [Terriglobales bacterium]|nr:hypothetical protein [Terriglobales bacterium]
MPGKRRRRAAILLGISVTVLLTILFALQAFNLSFVQPNTTGETLIFAALSALVFLLFIALSFVLVRTLLKLYAERRVGALGSKFRTKMVLGALVLSLGPVIFLFMFAYGLMNRSIERWFSTPVEEVRHDTATLGSLLSGYAQQNAQGEADSIAMAESTQRAFESGNLANCWTCFAAVRLLCKGVSRWRCSMGSWKPASRRPRTGLPSESSWEFGRIILAWRYRSSDSTDWNTWWPPRRWAITG